jgi:hypothetical protein
MLNRQVARQVRIDAVRLIAPTGVGLAVDGLDIQLSLQRADMFAADLKGCFPR